jgi:hypothetical protein
VEVDQVVESETLQQDLDSVMHVWRALVILMARGRQRLQDFLYIHTVALS